MKISLAGSKLLALSKKANPHSLSMATGISYPTVLRYTHPGGTAQVIDLAILSTFLSVDTELTPEQLAEMKIGDLFNVGK